MATRRKPVKRRKAVKGGKRKTMDEPKVLVLAAIVHPSDSGYVEARIVQQSHRGPEFGEESNWWKDEATGITLFSENTPEWNSTAKRLFVRGSHTDYDTNGMAIRRGDWDNVQQAVAAYNAYFSTKNQGEALTIESIVLPHAEKERIRAALTQYHKGDKLWREWGLGAVMEKGRAVSLLFYGPPGTGKTLMAEAVATEVKQKLRIIGTAELESSVPGQMERNVMQLFKEAKDKQVLLFDECDSLIYDRTDVGMILGAQINTLLSQLERHTGIVIFTTNRLGVLDAAMERRLACKVAFPFPDAAARVLIWKRLLPPKLPLDSRINVEKLAQVPLSGGHIKNCVLSAARLALYRELKEVTAECFAEAITSERQSIITWLRAQEEKRAPGMRGGGYARGTGGLEIERAQLEATTEAISLEDKPRGES